MEFSWHFDYLLDSALDKDRIEKGLDYPMDYIGAVKIGSLCYDLVEREGNDENDYPVLYGDLYVDGVDTGYGYSDNDVPYDFDDAAGFVLHFDQYNGMTVKQFKTLIESLCVVDINTNDKSNPLYSLVEKSLIPPKGFNW